VALRVETAAVDQHVAMFVCGYSGDMAYEENKDHSFNMVVDHFM
jgi:hypothetical protein